MVERSELEDGGDGGPVGTTASVNPCLEEAAGNIPFFSQHALKTLRTDFISNNRPISSLNPLPADSFENGSARAKRGSTLACEMRSPSG